MSNYIFTMNSLIWFEDYYWYLNFYLALLRSIQISVQV